MRVSLATRDERPVTINAEDAYPQWSPSRASVVYASNKVGDRRWRIYLQEDATDQQDVSPLLVEGNELFGNYPVYLDNWRIAYNGCDTWSGGSRCGIYAADSRGSRPVRVTDSPDDIPSGHLGSRVLFTARRAGNYDVWSANWDGSGLQQLTTDGANDGLAAGSPDGQMIAFVSERGGQWALWLMNADGSGQRKAFALPAVPGGPAGWLTERLGWGM
jgi:TolB protein